MWRKWMLCGLLLLVCGGCSFVGKEDVPAFKARFKNGGLDNDFGDFLDEHPGKKVMLDLQWERGAFHGGAEKEFQFFVLFESCAENLEKGEEPAVGNCNGTEYNVPKADGRAMLTEEGGVWRLRGVFQPGEKTGPLQGLFAVELEAVP
jgi:hypothetical protein